MKFLDNLPTVISCCFCCFLRAGTMMIGVVSFLIGIIFAPNISHAKGFWNLDTILSNYSGATESAIQIMIGAVSILLCVASIMLIIGACCNLPFLILVYQWGAIVYSGFVVVLFFILAMFCFFVHTNAYRAGTLLLSLIIINLILTAYFIIVANSLRVSLQFLRSDEYSSVV